MLSLVNNRQHNKSNKLNKLNKRALQQATKQASKQAGFTLLEVLVALVIVGTALSASLRAVANLTQNSGDLRSTMMANWSAENRLAQVRLSHEWPELGERSFPCPQGRANFVCEEHVLTTPNPSFRRVEVYVFENGNLQRRLVKLTQIVSNVP